MKSLISSLENKYIICSIFSKTSANSSNKLSLTSVSVFGVKPFIVRLYFKHDWINSEHSSDSWHRIFSFPNLSAISLIFVELFTTPRSVSVAMGMLTPLSVTVSSVPAIETLSSLAFSASGRPVILVCAIAATDSSLVSLMVNSSLTVSIALTCAPAGSAFNFSSSGVVKSLVERPLPASVLTLPASASLCGLFAS